MSIIQFTYGEVCKIHFANGYDKHPKAQEALNRLGNELGGAAWANAYNAKSFEDYSDVICEID